MPERKLVLVLSAVIVVLLLITFGLGVWALSLQQQINNLNQSQTTPTATPSPTNIYGSPTPTTSTYVTPTTTTSVTPTVVTWIPFTSNGKQAEGRQATYSISYRSDWSVTYNDAKGSQYSGITDAGAVLTLTKNGYMITVDQGGNDGGSCTLTTYSQINAVNYFFRYGVNTYYNNQGTDKVNYHFCYAKNATDIYTNGGSFGFVTYDTPLNPDPKMLAEMDSIVKTMTVIPD